MTGKALYKNVLAKTQKECKEKLVQAIEKNGKVDVVRSGKYAVAEWVRLWFETYSKPSIREQTAYYYNNYIEKHILPGIGSIKLEKLTTIQIQQFYNKLKTSGRVQRYEHMFPSPKTGTMYDPDSFRHTHEKSLRRQGSNTSASMMGVL